MQNCMFRTVRLFVWVWMKLKQNFNCFRPEKGYSVFIEDSILPSLTIYKVIRIRETGDIDEKYKMEWKLDEPNHTTTEEVFQHVMPPWLLITKDGEDYTEQLHPYIAKGNVIRVYFLNKKFGNGSWKILNTKTFEEEDFPSSGITIN